MPKKIKCSSVEELRRYLSSNEFFQSMEKATRSLYGPAKLLQENGEGLSGSVLGGFMRTYTRQVISKKFSGAVSLPSKHPDMVIAIGERAYGVSISFFTEPCSARTKLSPDTLAKRIFIPEEGHFHDYLILQLEGVELNHQRRTLVIKECVLNSLHTLLNEDFIDYTGTEADSNQLRLTAQKGSIERLKSLPLNLPASRKEYWNALLRVLPQEKRGLLIQKLPLSRLVEFS